MTTLLCESQCSSVIFPTTPQVTKKETALINVAKGANLWFGYVVQGKTQELAQIFQLMLVVIHQNFRPYALKTAGVYSISLMKGDRKVTEIQKHSEFLTEVFQLCSFSSSKLTGTLRRVK